MPNDRTDAYVHAPEGERGGGNPRQPQHDPRREGDVLTPGVKVPNEAPVPGQRTQGARDRDPQGDVRRHEADPPKPQREDGEEVPPYAGGNARGQQQKPGARPEKGGRPSGSSRELGGSTER
jgi:hypothetical protein